MASVIPIKEGLSKMAVPVDNEMGKKVGRNDAETDSLDKLSGASSLTGVSSTLYPQPYFGENIM